MSRIRLLDKSIYELIAAGEVVERPASVVKELVENSIDAGATSVSVDIVGNGLKSITVSDNGIGMDKDDIEMAFLRHATSKISDSGDLNRIHTLGFRGEALPSISAVTKISVVSRTRDAELGTHYYSEGGEKISSDEIGCDYGTTITVSDIFYNVPARMKFLKKDVTEGNAIQSIIEEEAMSNPGIAFRFVRDGKQVLSTQGDGKLYSTIYALLPRDISEKVIEVKGQYEDIKVFGYVSTPENSRKSRTWQYLSINGRPVKSKTVTAAAEEAFRNVMQTQRFPAFVLALEMPFENIDVNVHPTKTEVRFVNDRSIFNAVYSSVKNGVTDYSKNFKKVIEIRSDTPEYRIQEKPQPVTYGSRSGLSAKDREYRSDLSFDMPAARPQVRIDTGSKDDDRVLFSFEPKARPEQRRPSIDIERPTPEEIPEKKAAETPVQAEPVKEAPAKTAVQEAPEIQPQQETLFGTAESGETLRIIGEVFKTYIIAQYGDKLLYIDKHAAHERILFEKIDEMQLNESRQILLEPVVVDLPREYTEALVSGEEALEKAGYRIEDFGSGSVIVREIPTFMKLEAVKDAVTEMAEQLVQHKSDLHTEDEQWLMHSVSCRAAIKAGHKTSEADMLVIAEKIIKNEIPEFCPHGRPVVFAVTKNDLEKGFGRIR